MNNFSPNMLKTFALCPKKYYFKYVQNISMPQPASVFEKGKKIHALAHYYLQGVDISGMLNALNEDEKFIWQRLCENEFFQKKYVNSEYNLSCKVGDYWIGGRLDALMTEFVHDCNYESPYNVNSLPSSPPTLLPSYYILDYKTGSIPKNPDFDYQTMVYLLCADRRIKNYSSLNFVYIDLKNNQNCVIEFNDEKRIQYTGKLANICAQISETTDFASNSDKCKFCEYNKLCI